MLRNTNFSCCCLLIGDSTETSPSWASASSSAMQTPNDVDQPQLTFDFGRKCELNPDLRKQLVLPKSRVRKLPHYLNFTTFFLAATTTRHLAVGLSNV